MEVWQSVLAAIAGNAVVVAVLGWLAKAFLESVSARDAKRFELDLKATADQAIERFKGELQIRLHDHQVKVSRLHDLRATTIAEINSLLAETMWEAENFLSLMEFSGEPSKVEKHSAAMKKLVEFFRYFDKNKIYLPADLCELIETLVRDVRRHVIRFGTYVRLEQSESLAPHTHLEKDEAWIDGWKALTEHVPEVRRRLEDEFRRLLSPEGVETSQS